MRSQITALEALQQLDLERYPQEISRYKEETENTKQSLAKAKEELNQTRKRKMESESKLSGNKDKIKKAEVKLFEIKTYREYEALQKEIGDVKKANADLEEDILKEMETLEGLETEVKEKENTLNEKEKKKMVSLINPEIHTLYERIRRRNGVVIVQARNELCTGCNMNIPPQLFNEVLTSKRMIQCPNCQRILYCEETTEGEVQTA